MLSRHFYSWVLLTVGAHAPEDYDSHSVCVCVCLGLLPHFQRRLSFVHYTTMIRISCMWYALEYKHDFSRKSFVQSIKEASSGFHTEPCERGDFLLLT